MSFILSIETATTVCSVAITSGQNIVCEKKLFSDKSHANKLTLLIQELLKKAELKMVQMSAIAVSMGPGSYTGLRIGLSTAKGICFALNKPLIGISTLKAMAKEASINHKGTLLCPMIDARRMEVYTALYNQSLTQLQEPRPLILNQDSFAETLSSQKVLFFGNGADKFQDIMNSKNASFLKDFSPSAWAVGLLAGHKLENTEFENLAYTEPGYLKEFQATTPKPLL
ncbi:tRNA (adenosine(37)-N6)-threonylcarbamoyltransferase complex dimerization subunit type 1 TsaB [Roseivirga thermotolerans]|uniref:tRNA (Adenosine(37)-N6)-threonylcarbamoyltransferase complex dimerization subunit type 1 TsaB n=1 Tax=Roseivirga thermotolerans TaxID=1758176 RepID=A0ABQ3IF47_9BACT|nr:tRNA (adenosine(37)-N6)-threonylcarbamoyltransferase complex dimerization subunit type 1 TsaB [Roseivirga thermotolerans]GHE76238.1 tRNA (adenosine(37)-N6)-threonylcarbamoyltransferase complex dimerization subunit type 1 TsaB [Roseivirga thermotolerans]